MEQRPQRYQYSSEEMVARLLAAARLLVWVVFH